MDGQQQLSETTCATSLAQLGQSIKDNADKIEEHLRQNDIANPTFTLGGAIALDLPPALENARQILFDDIEHLNALLRGPLDHVLTHRNPVTFNYTVTLAAISRFQIADHVPLDGSPISIGTLAAACHLEQSDLTPLLRAAIAKRTFEAVGSSEIKHNAASWAIACKTDLRHWLAWAWEDFIPAAFALPEAIAQWPGGVAPAHTAFALSNPTHRPLFDAIREDDARAQRFARSMRLLGRAGAAEVPRVVDSLHLEGLSEGSVVVDLGGSTGDILIQVLRRYKQLRGIVQDLPAVVSKATVPDDLVGRMEFQIADFFEEQPVRGAAVYFMRKVLHDWSDEYARKILKQLVPALSHGSKIVVNEMCLPLPGSVHPRREQNQRGWDLAMKCLLNGKERDECEWEALFTSVDARFTFNGARPVLAASSSLIEFSWV